MLARTVRSLVPLLVTLTAIHLSAAIEENIRTNFPASSGGKLVVDVGFGGIEVTTNATSSQVSVEIFREVDLRSEAKEKQFLADRPVTFSREGETLIVRTPKPAFTWSSGRIKVDARYRIQVPANFNVALKTSGGHIHVRDLTGETAAGTAGGGLRFERLHGDVDGGTSGGGIKIVDCDGKLDVRTSGGGIEVSGGGGTLKGHTSGGSVKVIDFNGPADVFTSGGSITVKAAGSLRGKTSGGSIDATLTAPLTGELRLETSGGGVTLRLPADTACDLDARTSGGGVSSDLPVTITGKPQRDRLQGPIHGGGQPVVLRSSGGSIRVKQI